MPLLRWEAFEASDKDKREWRGDLTKRAALLCAGILILPLAWKTFVLGWKAHWFGPQGGRGRAKRISINQADADDLVDRWSLGRIEK